MRLLLPLLIFVVQLVYGQQNNYEPDSVSKVLMNHLKKEGVTQMIYLKDYCTGCLIETKPCLYERPFYNSYLIWEKEQKTFIKKMDNCGVYKLISVKGDIFEFYGNHKDVIKDEFIKGAMVKSDKNNSDTLIVTIDHSRHRNIIMYSDQDTIYHHINYFNLADKVGFESESNLNYSYNNNLQLIKFNKLINKLIGKLEKNNKFVREEIKTNQ